ncbi:hypothetical protein HU200_059963 [Digitaria exilis]|uniref:Uncharacterized protein n=1 Tax=Digitaria exilis TaxID=1010633 RepID=A0A835AHP7_9POAL|nr:hypothetical protein HU200_059963 [Digitaria exilis]
MGLLDHLWDDTVAGPRPDSGLGKLRKYASFSPSSSSSVSAAAAAPPPATPPPVTVTRSITMLRPSALSVATSPRSESSSAPSSPASGAPDSPFSAATTPKGEGWKRLRRKGRMATDGADAPGTPRSPTVYDWCGGDQLAGPVKWPARRNLPRRLDEEDDEIHQQLANCRRIGTQGP